MATQRKSERFVSTALAPTEVWYLLKFPNDDPKPHGSYGIFKAKLCRVKTKCGVEMVNLNCRAGYHVFELIEAGWY